MPGSLHVGEAFELSLVPLWLFLLNGLMAEAGTETLDALGRGVPSVSSCLLFSFFAPPLDALLE